MVDKYEVKSLVREKIGDGNTATCLGVFDRFSDIDFSKYTPYCYQKYALWCTYFGKD